MNNLNISFLICTKNSSSTIKRALESIEKISQSGDEIIICDASDVESEFFYIKNLANNNNILFLRSNGKESNIFTDRIKLLVAAKNKYVCFVDSDDALPVNFKIIRSKIVDGIDLCIYNTNYILQSKTFTNNHFGKKIKEIKLNKYIEKLLFTLDLNALWNYIINKNAIDIKLLNSFKQFPNLGEDRFMLLENHKNFKNIIYVPLIGYNYYITEISTSTTNKSYNGDYNILIKQLINISKNLMYSDSKILHSKSFNFYLKKLLINSIKSRRKINDYLENYLKRNRFLAFRLSPQNLFLLFKYSLIRF